MFSVLFSHFLGALADAISEAEKNISEATDAYTLASVACAMTGVRVETAYQQLPEMHARTVRRVLAGAVRMCMVDVISKEGIHQDTTESSVLVEIQHLASEAKVRPVIAMSAVTRYLNSPERVKRVLIDISVLQQAHCKVWNPTGLFTRLMRSGQDVKMPDRVKQQREENVQAAAARKAQPVPAVGGLVRLYGEVCRIVEVTRQFALVRTQIDDIRVPIDALRFVDT